MPPQDVEPLTARGRPDEHPEDRPQATQVGSVDEVSRVHEQDVTVTGDGPVEPGFQLRIEKDLLVADVVREIFFWGKGPAPHQRNPRPARNTRT